MRRWAATFVAIGLIAVPLGAQGRGGRSGVGAQGIPPGQLPPPGTCRVWYDNLPPGRQAPATSCREAERVASRDRRARVIYGANQDARDDGWWERNDRNGPRAIPRPDASRFPDRYPNGRGGYGYRSIPFDNGYKDGYDKGREDARDNDSYDPVRHSRYRAGDHGYDRRSGSKEDYKLVYRDGFEAGYDAAYRDTSLLNRPDRRR